MKKAITIALLITFGLAAQAPGAKASTKAAPKAAKKTTSTPHEIVIPKNAVAKPDGTYAWTDPQGKSWIFVRTPFGVMKTANSAEKQTTATSASAGVKAIDAGDKVRFETPTPFGVMKREKNKADLTDEEKALFNSQNPSNAKQD